MPPTDATTLCRSDLESGRMRDLYVEAVGQEGRALSDEQLSESLTTTLAAKPKGAGWWVFAYGSLLWNPLFPFADARPALLRGLHRRFCLYSMASRGTRERPGLVLGLDRGGACTGVAYRLPAPLAIDELHLLWRREMVVMGNLPAHNQSATRASSISSNHTAPSLASECRTSRNHRAAPGTRDSTETFCHSPSLFNGLLFAVATAS